MNLRELVAKLPASWYAAQDPPIRLVKALEKAPVIENLRGNGNLEPELTEKNLMVLKWASHGLHDVMIAEVMGVSENTLRTHWRRILRVLGAKNRTQAVAKAIREGVIE